MTSINPHIHFNGNTKEAFEFYRSVLGSFRDKYGVEWMVEVNP